MTLFSLSFHQMPKLVIKNHLIGSHLASAWIIILMSNPVTASPGSLFHFVTALFVKSTLAESAILLFIPGSISAAHREKNKKLNFFFPMTHIFTRLTPSYLFSRPNTCRSFHCFSCDVVLRAYTILGLHLSVCSSSSKSFINCYSQYQFNPIMATISQRKSISFQRGALDNGNGRSPGGW